MLPLLIFRFGAMKSGKTLHLLKLLSKYISASKHVLLAKSVIEREGDCGFVVSRACMDERVPVDYLFDASFDFTRDIPNLSKANCILVDESQFLTEAQVEQLKVITRRYEIEVVCYGLLTDFKTRLFEGSKRLVEQCDTLEEIESRCQYCPNNAKYNMRQDESGKAVFEGELVKENDVYHPVCWSCYNYNRGPVSCKVHDTYKGSSTVGA